MGAIETLSRLAGLVSTVRAGQEEDFKYIAAQQEKQRKAQLEGLKYITGRYTDLYFSAKGNTALQENILQTMQDMKGSLPPAFRQQFEVFTKAGPFSKTNEDLRRWTEINGAGPRPLIEEETQNPAAVAAHKFAELDYMFSRQHFLTGQAPTNKPRVVSVNETHVAYRGKNEIPYLMTHQEFGLMQTCDILGINYGQALANGGVVHGTETFTTVSNGQETTYKTTYDLLNRKAPTQVDKEQEPSVEDYRRNISVLSSKRVSEKAHWESPLLTEVLTNVITNTDDSETVGGKIASRVLDFMSEVKGKGIPEIEKALNQAVEGIPAFNNIHLVISDEQYDVEGPFFNVGDWFGQYGLSKFARIIPIYGEMTPFKSSDGFDVGLIRDPVINRVYNADGQNIGDLDQAVSIISQKPYKELTGEEPPARAITAVPGALPGAVQPAAKVAREAPPKKEDYYREAGVGKMFPTSSQREKARELAREDMLKVARILGFNRGTWNLWGDIAKWVWGTYDNFIGQLVAGQRKARERLGEE